MYERNSQSGISIIEILVVLVISEILVSFAVAQFGNSKVVFQKQNFAREFKVNLERARFDSVKRNAVAANKRANLMVKANAASFDLTIDRNQNDIIDVSDTRTIEFSRRSNVKIVGDTGVAGGNVVFPVTITSDHRGHITSEDSSTPKKNVTRFIFCTDNCTVANAKRRLRPLHRLRCRLQDRLRIRMPVLTMPNQRQPDVSAMRRGGSILTVNVLAQYQHHSNFNFMTHLTRRKRHSKFTVESDFTVISLTDTEHTQIEEAGFSLVEVAIAMIIILVALLGVFVTFTYAISYNAGNNSRAQAIAVLQREVELLRSAKFTPTVTGNCTPGVPDDGKRDIRGSNKATRTITSADGNKFVVDTKINNDPNRRY